MIFLRNAISDYYKESFNIAFGKSAKKENIKLVSFDKRFINLAVSHFSSASMQSETHIKYEPQ